MSRSQRFGCLVYPFALLIFLSAPGIFAQNPASAPPPVQPQNQQTQEQPENPQENQIRLAQEAQARIKARRQQRVERMVRDTYTHKFEIYGGGGYLRFRPGGKLQHINESAWNVGFSDYLWPRLAVTGEIRGYYGTAYIGVNDFGIFKPSITQYVFMGGPQYRLVRRVHWAIGAQVLGGAAKGIFNGNSANFPGTLLGLWQNGTNFAVGAAVPIDYNLGPELAFRISPNYLLTNFGGTMQVKNLGFTSGLVFRFGRR